MKLNKQKKFEALLHRHADMSNLLQVMMRADLRIFSGFLTLQFAFGGFISQFSLSEFGKIGLFIIDLALASTCYFILRNHNERRNEVVQTLKNCNEALGYNEPGVYIESKPLNSKTERRPWLKFYIISNIITVIGIGFILFFGNPKPKVDGNSMIKKALNIPMKPTQDTLNTTIIKEHILPTDTLTKKQ
ncbi:hypothetical protein [uncultured Algibacter sp.]|uniref:hypothetical protein n=1 Tax=uncultured Algibacter sp. TaxID=298659 RepID=UPI00260872A4|nr:hypothetical protein [uncultured Algibacter sp.]